MPRSPLTEQYRKVEAMVFHVQENLNADEYALFLDMVAPLPEQPEVPVKKTRKKRTQRAQPLSEERRKKLQAAAAHANQQLSGGNESAACAECPNGPDDNIHHKTSMEGYHEFKEAA